MDSSPFDISRCVIEVDDAPAREAKFAISDGLEDFNESVAPCDNLRQLWVVARDEKGTVIGGLQGVTLFGWLYIGVLWVHEAARRKGLGAQLLSGAEAEARARGVLQVYLDTFSFQAPEFYRKQGYREFGRLSDFPPGHQRIFMTKSL
jgi:GNAT superfamily N-acetyltransferase